MAGRVGILTGGGDVPGLNAVIRGLVWRLEEAGWQVLGLRRGWSSLIHVRPDAAADNSDWLVPLNRETTRRIERFGGTILHSTRLNPALMRPRDLPEHLGDWADRAGPDGLIDLTPAALQVLDFLDLQALVAVGGDGTLSFARHLHREGRPVIGIPKTMDNDVYGTDYCIGFSTAVSRSVQFINDLRTAAGSHERFLVVELFGRHSGETCLLASYLASADRALIAEVPFDLERVGELLAADRRDNPSRYAVLAVSEGAYPEGSEPMAHGEPDPAGQRRLGGIGATVAHHLEHGDGVPVIYQRLGYLMRSGAPDSLDLLVAKNYATLAADLVLAGRVGQMVAIVDGRYVAVPLATSGDGIRRVDVASFYDREQYRPRVSNVMGLPMFLH